MSRDGIATAIMCSGILAAIIGIYLVSAPVIVAGLVALFAGAIFA